MTIHCGWWIAYCRIATTRIKKYLHCESDCDSTHDSKEGQCNVPHKHVCWSSLRQNTLISITGVVSILWTINSLPTGTFHFNENQNWPQSPSRSQFNFLFQFGIDMIDDGRANANNTKVQHDDDDFNRLWVKGERRFWGDLLWRRCLGRVRSCSRVLVIVTERSFSIILNHILFKESEQSP